MDFSSSETNSIDCETPRDTLFPVDAIVKILQMKIGDESSPTSKKKTTKSVQSQFKNIYSLVVGHAHALLKELTLSLKKEDQKKVQKENVKTAEEWSLEMQQFNIKLAEFESLDEKYSMVRKEAKSCARAQEDAEKLEELRKEKDSLYSERKKVQKILLKNLYYKRFSFMAPVFRLVDNGLRPYLTKDRINSFMEDKKNSCSKSRALTTLSLYLQNDLKIGLLIVHIVLGLLASNEEDKEANTMFEKSAMAFRYWMIKSAMTTKTKSLLNDKKKRAHIYHVFDNVSANLKEKLRKELNEEDLKCLEEISGKPKRKPLFNLNGKRPFAEDHTEFPIKKQIKKSTVCLCP